MENGGSDSSIPWLDPVAHGSPTDLGETCLCGMVGALCHLTSPLQLGRTGCFKETSMLMCYDSNIAKILDIPITLFHLAPKGNK